MEGEGSVDKVTAVASVEHSERRVQAAPVGVDRVLGKAVGVLGPLPGAAAVGWAAGPAAVDPGGPAWVQGSQAGPGPRLEPGSSPAGAAG